MSETKCPRCQGTGSVQTRLGKNSPSATCTLCKGTGTAPVEDSALVVTPELLEELAALEHDKWANVTTSHLKTLAPGGWVTRAEDETDEAYEARTQRIMRWHRLAETPYANLAEDMKELDREQARRSLAIIGRHAQREEGERGGKAMAGP